MSNDEHCRDHGISQPPSSHLGIKILRTDLAETSLDIVGLTIQLRELPQASTKVSNSDVASGDIVQYYEQDSRSHNSAPIYRELYDSASSIVTEILRQPRLIVESVASIAYNGSSSSSASQSIVAFIAMNRILHPYFTNSSSTTSLLIEAIIHQSEQSRCMQYDNADEDDCRRIVASLFIQHVKIWSPLVHPLPVTPNVKSETFLTTILKLYAVRVDVTAFFRNLWSPVLPSVVAIVNNLNDNVERGVSCNLKNIVKVAMRLLSHTFSEKSITSFPSPAVAVCRAIYTLCGNTGVYIYLFDLLVLPNLVKILSLSEYDNVGSSVMKQFHTYYTQKSWWFDSNRCTEYNPVSSLIWITWKLFTGAVHTDDTLLSVLSSRDFFSDGPILDIRSMPDQRLRNVLSLLKRSLNKSWQLLLHLPLDEKGCEIFDTDATLATTNLKIALPHLAQDLNRRLDTLFEKPTEIIGALVISRYEASTFFDAVSAAVSNCRRIDGKEETEKERNKNQSKSLLREEIASYHLLEGVINETVPLSLRPTSEQMVLHILRESPVSVSPDKDVGHLHKQLSRGLLLAKSYEKVLRSTLSRLQEGRINRVEDLIDQEFKLISSPLTFSPSSSSNMGAQNTDIFYPNDKFQDFHQSPTHTSALKVLNPHRGVVPVIRAVDCMTQQRIEGKHHVLTAVF